MRKILLFVVVLITMSSTAFAQGKGSVKGNLKDSYSAEGVMGAVIQLIPANSSATTPVTTSGYEGSFTLNSVPYGEYTLKATFIGYEDFVKTITVGSERLILGDLGIKVSSTEIDAVVKEVQALRTSQHGDTLSYSASAYKVAADADVEGLLKKMPGITISDDGEVSAQGETIQKIFVDGREFFGSDVTTAISSLPAEIVDNIEVFDKLSDDAELSGMDDGNSYKSINIVTKSNMREGAFGRIYAGYGYQPEVEGDLDHNKYLMGGNISYFKGKHRVSVIGLLNNINQQNFSFDDILGVSDGNSNGYMVRPQSGVAEVQAIGVNYSGAFGATENINVEASYFYNATQTENYATTERWYEDPLAVDTLYQAKDSYTPNTNHRMSARVEWKITPTQQLTFRQSGSFQSNNSEALTLGAMYGESGYSIIDTYNLNDRSGYYSASSLSYITRLGKAGRTISLNAGLNFREQDKVSSGYSNAATGYLSPVIATDTAGMVALYGSEVYNLSYTKVYTPTTSRTLSAEVSYAEPIGQRTRLTFKYRVTDETQETEKSSYDTDSDFNYTESDLNDASSNHYESTYITQQVGPGLYYSNGKSKLTLGVNYQIADLTGSALVDGGSEEPLNREFKNFTYAASGQLFFTPQTSLRLNFSTKTSNPNVSYLVDAYDLSDVQYISIGNSELIPSYATSLRMHFVHSSVERGSTFMIFGGINNTTDYLGQHVVYSPGTVDIGGTDYSPLQYSTTVNLDQYWSYHTSIEYGFPIPFIKSNLNLRGSANYTLTPSMIGGTILDDGSISGGELNQNESTTYSSTAVLGSNISENADFTISWTGSYSEAINSASSSSEVNKYLSQSASLSSKFVFGPGITFTGAAQYSEYKGITNDYADSYVTCSVYLGKQIFRNKRGELKVGVNDLFDQNTSFSRTVGTGYTQNTYNTVIGRYYTVQLVYNLRSFGNQQGKGEGGQRGPGGMGGGMGGGGNRPMRP